VTNPENRSAASYVRHYGSWHKRRQNNYTTEIIFCERLIAIM